MVANTKIPRNIIIKVLRSLINTDRVVVRFCMIVFCVLFIVGAAKDIRVRLDSKLFIDFI